MEDRRWKREALSIGRGAQSIGKREERKEKEPGGTSRANNNQ
jgi:hypothetical protein